MESYSRESTTGPAAMASPDPSRNVAERQSSGFVFLQLFQDLCRLEDTGRTRHRELEQRCLH
eukprot:1657497-Amphidinium_carterae.1